MNIRYAGAQFAFWMTSCSVISFAVVFLQAKGFSNSLIGIMMAVANLLGYLMSGIMSDIIDRYENITVFEMLHFTVAVQAIATVSIIFIRDNTALLTVVYTIAMMAALARNPLITQLCVHLQYSGEKINFSVTRGIGSLAYVLASMLLGNIVSRFSSAAIPYFTLAMLSVQAIVDIGIQRKVKTAPKLLNSNPDEKAFSTMEFIRRNPQFALLGLGATLVFFGHNTVNNYLINIMRYLGGDEKIMGYVGGFTTAFELPIMFLFVPVMKKYKISVSTAMKLSFIAFAMKNILTAMATSILSLCAAASLQGFSYGVYTAACVSYAKSVIPQKDAAKAQALLTNVSMGGTVLAGLFGGWLYDNIGVRFTMIVCAAVLSVGCVIGFLNVQKVNTQEL